MSFIVMEKPCSTCIYKPDMGFNIQELEKPIFDRQSGIYTNFRQCHHHKKACCRGFWSKNKDRFLLGILAERLQKVEFTGKELSIEEIFS